jgi:hypothetical protein
MLDAVIFAGPILLVTFLSAWLAIGSPSRTRAVRRFFRRPRSNEYHPGERRESKFSD